MIRDSVCLDATTTNDQSLVLVERVVARDSHASLPWWFGCCLTQRGRPHPSWICEFAACDQTFRNVDNPDCPRYGQRQSPDAALAQTPPDTAYPSDAETVSQTDIRDLVWRLSFWKEVCRQCQCEWRAPNCIVDPMAW